MSTKADLRRPLSQRAMTILWPAFLVAGLLEMVVFAMVDPGEMHGPGGAPLGLSAEAVYSLAFLMFWGALSLSGIISFKLNAPSKEVHATAHQQENAAG